jgi:aspartyl-tRNA(Asn)/glutamyl-tRNA(Gln) amidotransferase subunit A
MGSSNETSFYGPCATPGIPSGARRLLRRLRGRGGRTLCAAATGTDTGGSIRQPAAFCGITGIKPTYGRCLALGHDRLRLQPGPGRPHGPLRRRRALMLQAMAGFDPRDSTSVDTPCRTTSRGLDATSGLRIGLPKEYFGEGLDPAVAASIQEAIGEYEAWGPGERDQPAQQPALGPGLLRGRPGGVLLQPGPLRRGALRPPLRQSEGPGPTSTSAAAPRASGPRSSAAS